jgi:hypothetical protein
MQRPFSTALDGEQIRRHSGRVTSKGAEVHLHFSPVRAGRPSVNFGEGVRSCETNCEAKMAKTAITERNRQYRCRHSSTNLSSVLLAGGRQGGRLPRQKEGEKPGNRAFTEDGTPRQLVGRTLLGLRALSVNSSRSISRMLGVIRCRGRAASIKRIRVPGQLRVYRRTPDIACSTVM